METCETGTVDYSHKTPKIKKCGKPATHYFGGPGLQAAVCSECLEIMKKKHPNAPVEKI